MKTQKVLTTTQGKEKSRINLEKKARAITKQQLETIFYSARLKSVTN